MHLQAGRDESRWLSPATMCLIHSLPFLIGASRAPESRNVFVWPTIETARRLDYANISLFMGVLALYCLLFRALAFLAIFRLKHNRRT